MNLNLVDSILPEFDPETYVVDDGLRQAAEVAFALRKPYSPGDFKSPGE